MQLGRSAAHDDGAGIQHIGAVGSAQGAVHVLLDDQDRDALPPQIEDRVIDLARRSAAPVRARARRAAAAWARQQGAGDGQHLLLAAATACPPAADTARAGPGTSPARAPCRRPIRPIGPHGGAERDVLRNRQGAEDVSTFRDQRDALGRPGASGAMPRIGIAGEADIARLAPRRRRRSPAAGSTCRRRSGRSRRRSRPRAPRAKRRAGLQCCRSETSRLRHFEHGYTASSPR